MKLKYAIWFDYLSHLYEIIYIGRRYILYDILFISKLMQKRQLIWFALESSFCLHLLLYMAYVGA